MDEQTCPFSALPTLSGSVPLLGHLPAMLRRFPELCARGIATHGSLFFIHGALGVRYLVCAEPSILDVLNGQEVSTSSYIEGATTLLGGTLLSFDGEAHRRIRLPMSSAFTPKQLTRSNVLKLIHTVASEHIARWLRAGRIAVLPATQNLALEIIMRLIGIPMSDLELWRKKYYHYLLGALPSRYKTPLHLWAERARNWLDQSLREVMEDLRTSKDESSFIGAIANTRDESGALLPLDLLVPNVRLLIFAGHETTASGFAWTLLEQARSSESQERAWKEVQGVSALTALAADSQQFTWAERQFREALRLYPPVHSLTRQLTAPLTVAGVKIPAGTVLMVPIISLLRDPGRWSRPSLFDPTRFEFRPRATTIETIMFGGGPHFCLGYHVSIAEGTMLLLTLAQALSAANLRMVPDGPYELPPPVWLPLGHPCRKLAVRFEPA